ncbi:unnamed protein product, partial [Symbiodinium natans]
MEGTLNYSVALGDFSGGGLLLESPEGKITLPLPDSEETRCFVVHDTKAHPLAFDGSLWHGTQTFSGNRWVITAYTCRRLEEVRAEDIALLKSLSHALAADALPFVQFDPVIQADVRDLVFRAAAEGVFPFIMVCIHAAWSPRDMEWVLHLWLCATFCLGFTQSQSRSGTSVEDAWACIPMKDLAEVGELRKDISAWFSSENIDKVDWCIPEGQPYCLHALATLSHFLQDVDTTLFGCLLQGVPTGFKNDIPPSGCMAPSGKAGTDESLQVCQQNWQGAEDDPVLLDRLVQQEVDK